MRTLLIIAAILMVWARVLAGEVSNSRYPLVTAAKTEGAPVIDGKIDEAEWKAAAVITGFIALDTAELAEHQTLGYIMFDEDNLYIAAKCVMPKGAVPKGTVKERDGKVWEDEAVEVFFDPKHSHSEHYQFIGNCIGTVWDSYVQDGSWNAHWDYQAFMGEGFWSAEFRIPFSSLGTRAPKDGEVWGFNLARDCRSPSQELSSWSFTEGGFHNTGHFGHLKFLRNGPIIKIKSFGRLSWGELNLQGEALAIEEPELSIETELYRLERGAKAELLHSETQKCSLKLPEVIFVRRISEPGTYRFTASILDPEFKETYYVASVPFSIPPPLEITLKQFHFKGEVQAELNVRGTRIPPENLRAQVELWKAGAEKATETLFIDRFDDKKVNKVTFDVSKLGAGDYEIIARLLDSQGKEVEMKKSSFKKPEKPKWLGSKAGITEEVMAPWTPLKVSGKAIKCWGRTYEFVDLPFPAKVVTVGKSILAAPVELQATVEGKEVKWTKGKVAVTRKSAPKVTLKASAVSEYLNLEGDVLIEYDGMMKINFALVPKKETTIDNLTLKIPMKPQWATLYHFWPGRWGSAFNSGAVPKEGLSGAFKPFLWLGNEDGGLSWFSESDKGWVNKEADKAWEVVRENGAVVLKVNFIDTPQIIREPLKYTIGFQATPVKPVPKDWHEWRICHGAYYGMETQPMRRSVSLIYPAKGNINLQQGTLEAWVQPMFDPKVKVDPKDPSRGIYNREFFALDLPGDMVASVYWNIDDRGMRFYVRKGQNFPIVMGSHSDWNKGEKHHIAFTWGSEAKIYVDGKLLVSQAFKGLLGDGNDQPLDNAYLRFGGGACEFVVDEIRISDIPRESFELTGECAADDHTLLLDHLNESFLPDGDRQTRAEKISGQSQEKGGTPGLGGSFVPAKFGTGFALFESGPVKTALDYAKEKGVKTLVYHENWTDIQNYDMVGHEEQLKNLVKECHKRGIKLLLYFGYEMSNIAPEWGKYARECLVRSPEAPLPTTGGYHRQPEQRAFVVCYNSPWQDFLAEAINHMVEEYDIDGVYLDGTIEPFGCPNYLHGCGYQKPDGSWAPTYPIFAVRNLMKRIYAICTKKKGGLVNPHQSTCCTIPTLAFSHSYWDGEQFGGGELAGDPLKLLPLEAFRAEFMGKNWGLGAEFLVYERPPNWTFDWALAFTMLHDVCVRPGGVGAQLEKVSKIWDVWSGFGVQEKDCQWHPYWRNEHLVKAAPEEVKVSLYSRGSKGCLLVVSNLGKEDTVATVDLDLRRLGLSGKKLDVQDALSQEKFTIKDSELQVPLPRMRMRMLWVFSSARSGDL